MGTSNVKNLVSNIAMWAFIIVGSVSAYMDALCDTCEINILGLVIVVGGAILSYLTGKGPDGKKLK